MTDSDIKNSLSMGIAVCQGEEDFSQAYEKAGKVLYCSKRNGRNQYFFN